FIFFLFCDSYSDYRDIHSFPTRRSSDLPSIEVLKEKLEYRFDKPEDPLVYVNLNIKLAENKLNNFDRSQYRVKLNISHSDNSNRSEEHTSELQSRFDLVCRLLLEKNKIL